MTDDYVPDVSLSDRDREGDDEDRVHDTCADDPIGEAATNGAEATSNSSGTSANGAEAATNGSGASSNGSGASSNGSGASSNGDADATDGDSIGGDANGLDLDVSHPDETDDDEVEPVELLVQLAEEGEIEPWDIDIVQVTDAFLEKLDATDLRTTGRALFYASVLLRMKSDEMLADDDDDEEPEPEPWEVAMEGGEEAAAPDFDPVDQLEAEMDRRLQRKSTRGSPETLDELVRELREAERGSWWKQSREYDTSDSPSGYDRGTQTLNYHTGDEFRQDDEPTEGEVTDKTHDEDIEEVITDVETALRTQYEKGRNEVLFGEVESVGGRPFMTFLALLFMAHRGTIRLQQDDLFGDLWIKDPAATAGETEVPAD